MLLPQVLKVCKCTNERVPHFNARLFLENKEEIGKVDAPWLKLGAWLKLSTFSFLQPAHSLRSTWVQGCLWAYQRLLLLREAWGGLAFHGLLGLGFIAGRLGPEKDMTAYSQHRHFATSATRPSCARLLEGTQLCVPS